MKSHRKEPRTSSEQAAEWLCALQEGGEAEQIAFLEWLRKSPRHVEEFLLVTATWRELRQLGSGRRMEIEAIIADLQGASSNVVALAESMAPALSARSAATQMAGRERPHRPVAWAAGLVALAMTAAAGWWLFAGTKVYSTGIGEQRTVRLEDGSVLYLNATSRARVHFTKEARDIELLRGDALFVVAQGRLRPFRVTAGATVIQAVGTQFSVLRHGEATRVSVLEGRVKVASHSYPSGRSDPGIAPANLFAAGEEATVSGSGQIIRSRAPDIAQAVAWRERRLVFRAERLVDVVAEINRYSPRQFRVVGDRARDTRLTATFDADRPEALAAFLSGYSDLVVRDDGAAFVIQERASATEP
jgi:transmembrane sensor